MSDRLVDTYIGLRGQIARLVMRFVPPKEVEDIVQETYVRICQVENKEAIRAPRSYIFRTAQNLALDYLKRSESQLTDGVDIDELPADNFLLPTEEDPTLARAASDEEFVLFCEAVRSLPRQSRRAFVLKKVYGYTLKEIMAEMNLGQATVETHIVNGTKKCVQYLRDRREGGQKPTGHASGSRKAGRRSSHGRRGENA